jgi:hypothetical protein
MATSTFGLLQLYKDRISRLQLLLLFSAIGFAPGGSGPYTTQLQQKNIQ